MLFRLVVIDFGIGGKIGGAVKLFIIFAKITGKTTDVLKSKCSVIGKICIEYQLIYRKGFGRFFPTAYSVIFQK